MRRPLLPDLSLESVCRPYYLRHFSRWRKSPAGSSGQHFGMASPELRGPPLTLSFLYLLWMQRVTQQDPRHLPSADTFMSLNLSCISNEIVNRGWSGLSLTR